MIPIDRYHAISAEGGCIQYARQLRKEAKLRRNGGERLASHRRWLRMCADEQDAAAQHIRAQIDAYDKS